MACLYQNKQNGYWYLRVFNGRVNGKSKFRLLSSGLKTTGKKPSPEVMKWEAEQTIKIVDNTLPTAEMSRATVRENSKSYLRGLDGILTQKSINDTAHYFERMMLTQEAIGHGSAVLADYTKRTFVEDFKNHRNTVAKLAPRTVKEEIRLIRKLLKRAKLLTDDVRELWDENRPKVEPSTLGRDVRDEIARIEAIADTDKGWTVAWQATKFAYGAGLRRDELCKLKIGVLALDNYTLKISRHIDEMGEKQSGTKTNAGARTIILGRDGLAAAKFLYARYQGICKELGIEESDDHFLLPANLSYAREGKVAGAGERKRSLPEGRGFDPNYHVRSWSPAWYALLKAAGIPKGSIRFHDLRHTYATRLAEANIPVAVAQQMVGHMTPEMVRYYTHISDPSMKRAVVAMETGKQFHEVSADEAHAYLEQNAAPGAKLTGTPEQLDTMKHRGGVQ